MIQKIKLSVFLLVVAIAIFTCLGKNYSNEEVAYSFVGFINAGEYEHAYVLLSEKNQNRISYFQFIDSLSTVIRTLFAEKIARGVKDGKILLICRDKLYTLQLVQNQKPENQFLPKPGI